MKQIGKSLEALHTHTHQIVEWLDFNKEIKDTEK